MRASRQPPERQPRDLDLFAAAAAIPGSTRDSAVSIATITQIAKEVMEGAFMPLWVRGEISDFKAHRNGHWYFCLRDADAQMRCVIWSRDQRRMAAAPDDGMQVVAQAQLSVYAARGEMQLVVTALDAVGDGLRRKALDLTRARLAADGLLDAARKRPLSRFPTRVAVITSPDGAALHDIIAVVRRRCSTVEIVIVPAKVQGETAPDELVAALDRVRRWGQCDTVIIGRGGGAREDLWAFNEERVARAVADCPIPTISAVGHEVDITLCDLVADLRAATPSAAAEAAVPLLAEERVALSALASAMRSGVERTITRARDALKFELRSLARAAERDTERRRARVDRIAGQLHALSPMATLARGYAVARGDDGSTLSSADSFQPGRRFALLLRDGTVRATVDREAATGPLNAPAATDASEPTP